MKLKKAVGKAFVAFVLVSLGFALGKETARRPAAPPAVPAAAGAERVVAYYLHASFRCMTCNLVESMGEALIAEEFAEQVEAGRLRWVAVNYEEDTALAERYDVAGNTIVVAKFRDGREVAHRRLDRVMELANRREAFRAYVRDGVRAVLEDGA